MAIAEIDYDQILEEMATGEGMPEPINLEWDADAQAYVLDDETSL